MMAAMRCQRNGGAPPWEQARIEHVRETLLAHVVGSAAESSAPPTSPSFDMLRVILEQTQVLLQADGVALFVFDTRRNEPFANLAFGECMPMCQNWADHPHAAQHPNGGMELDAAPDAPACISFFAHDGVAGSLCACRHARAFNAAERRMLAALSTIVTNALFDEHRFKLECEQTYDRTLEGWVQALELRDHETKEHSRRVTAMTVALARACGIAGPELTHTRRGALLHDIGKLAIPDYILRKPGPLTADEWHLMRQHPTYAAEMLRPIPFLQPALGIPLTHHEKWDGSGYPAGLVGKQIPLEGRLFALVDVWDALRFDRPYRAAWPAWRIRAHIEQQAGSHFDPELVSLFLEQLKDTPHVFYVG